MASGLVWVPLYDVRAGQGSMYDVMLGLGSTV